jgi:hypothetical protein
MKASTKGTVQMTRNGRVLIVRIPVSFRQSAGRKQIVVPAGADTWQAPRIRCDNSLINALAKAHRWRRLIETGRYASAAELSDREGINESYVCRVLRLTLLAPDIVEAILNGRQPKTLDLRSLLKPFPAEWDSQRRHFSFA